MSNLEKHFISPKVDFVFKQLFGKEKNIELLQYLLSAILNMKEEDIKDIRIKNSEFIREHDQGKTAQFDVCATFNNKVDVDIEIQVFNWDDMMKRCLYYWSIMYYNTLKKGMEYKNLRKCISVIISDYNVTKSKKPHSIYRLIEVEDGLLYNNDLEIHIIELKKLKLKHADNKDSKDFYSIMEFLNSTSIEEAKEIVKDNLRIGDIMEKYEEISREESTWAQALVREKTIRDSLIREKKIAEAEKKIKEAQRKEAEAQRKEAEAQRKEAEVKEREAKARRKEAEVKEREAEAQRKEAEAENKKKELEEEKKMIQDKAMIKAYLTIGLSYEEISKKMNLSIHEIKKLNLK